MSERSKYGPWPVFTATPELLQEISYLRADGQTLPLDRATGKVLGLTFLQEVAMGLTWQASAPPFATDAWNTWQHSLRAQGFEVHAELERTYLSVVIRGVVERDDNVALYVCMDLLERVREQMALQAVHLDVQHEDDAYLSVYVWVPTAVDTPQIDLSASMLRLLADLQLTVNVVMYNYEPDE